MAHEPEERELIDSEAFAHAPEMRADEETTGSGDDSSPPGLPVASLRNLKKAYTRQRLMQVAREMFARDGIQNTSMEDIARAAGASRNTIYAYFAGRQEIVRELAAEMWELTQGVCEEFAAIAVWSPETVQTWLRRVLDHWDKYADSIKFALRESGAEAMLQKRFPIDMQVDALQGAPYSWRQQFSPEEYRQRTFILLTQLYGVLLTLPMDDPANRESLVLTLADIWSKTLA